MRPQRSVTWRELQTYVERLVVQTWNLPEAGQIYGVPTGGSIIAVLFQAERRDRGKPTRLVDTLEGTTGRDLLVIDDVCDSGNTLSPFRTRGVVTCAVFVREKSQGCVDYSAETTDAWIHFPYEHEFVGREIATRVLQLIGDDPSREGLRETPERLLRTWREIFIGYQNNEPKITTFTSPADQMVTLRGIDFVSFCEHHVLPFYGVAHVGYLPDGKVLGLSKLARLVEYRSRRLQIQERLTNEIADAVQTAVAPKGIGVVLEATHMCMVARGVKKDNCVMSTSVLRGAIRDEQAAREEFFILIGRRP